jgi:hypothetical protein
MKLIMRNEPNFQKSQMFITVVSTRNYNEKCELDTWSKRTQTKPILPALTAGKIALSEVEGPVESILFATRNVGLSPVRDALRQTASVFEPALGIVVGLQGRRNHIADGVILS